jgi:hypothetical protein
MDIPPTLDIQHLAQLIDAAAEVGTDGQNGAMGVPTRPCRK